MTNILVLNSSILRAGFASTAVVEAPSSTIRRARALIGGLPRIGRSPRDEVFVSADCPPEPSH